jgi:hypothetical protein
MHQKNFQREVLCEREKSVNWESKTGELRKEETTAAIPMACSI